MDTTIHRKTHKSCILVMRFTSNLEQKYGTTLFRLNKSRNIYRRADVAKNFDRVRLFLKLDELKHIFQEILKDFVSQYSVLKIFEGGCGTGNITFLLCDILLEHKINWQITAVDNSSAMLNVFSQKISRFNKYIECVENNNLVFGYGDLDFRLPFPSGNYNFVFLSGVVHCLSKWQDTIKEIVRVLSHNGILVFIYETDKLIRKICGDNVHLDNEMFSNFWEEYWRLREEFRIPRDEHIKLVYDLEVVSQLLDSLNKKHTKKGMVANFNGDISFSKCLSLIKYGHIHATGFGVTKSARQFLYEEMFKWCEKSKLDINKCYPHIYRLNIDCFVIENENG